MKTKTSMGVALLAANEYGNRTWPFGFETSCSASEGGTAEGSILSWPSGMCANAEGSTWKFFPKTSCWGKFGILIWSACFVLTMREILAFGTWAIQPVIVMQNPHWNTLHHASAFRFYVHKWLGELTRRNSHPSAVSLRPGIECGTPGGKYCKRESATNAF